jgi:hypothetical protein
MCPSPHCAKAITMTGDPFVALLWPYEAARGIRLVEVSLAKFRQRCFWRRIGFKELQREPTGLERSLGDILGALILLAPASQEVRSLK